MSETWLFFTFLSFADPWHFGTYPDADPLSYGSGCGSRGPNTYGYGSGCRSGCGSGRTKNIRILRTRISWCETGSTRLLFRVLCISQSTYCTYIPRVPQCMSPRLNSDSHTPSPASECAPPPEPKGGGTIPWHSLYKHSLYVTKFIRTFFIRDRVYTGQSLYGTKFIQDKVYTRTKFIQWQSLYEDKVYTNFFHSALELRDIKWKKYEYHTIKSYTSM